MVVALVGRLKNKVYIVLYTYEYTLRVFVVAVLFGNHAS